METITGTAVYRERMMMRPGATLSVTLEDVSRADAPSQVIAREDVPLSGGPPYPFTLTYDPALVQERHRYSLRARMEVAGRLLFTSTESIPPFDRDPSDPLEIVLSAVGGASRGAGR